MSSSVDRYGEMGALGGEIGMVFECEANNKFCFSVCLLYHGNLRVLFTACAGVSFVILDTCNGVLALQQDS